MMCTVEHGLALFGLCGRFYRKVIHPSKRTKRNSQDCLTERLVSSKQLHAHARDNVWLLVHSQAQIVFPAGTLPHLWNASHPTHGPILGLCRECGFISSPKNTRSCACVRTCVLSCCTFPCLFSFILGHDAQRSGAQS